MKLDHFTLSEFDSPDEPGSGARMQQSMLEKLDRAREWAGVPFRISSGYRTPEHNKSVGGVENSAHIRGYAADIRIDGYNEAAITRMIAALTLAGFTRIGKARTFLHVDDDPEKPTPAYWDYITDDTHVA